MDFKKIKLKDVHSVVRYNTNMRSWTTHNRKNHIIGIKIRGSALHDFGYKKFVLSGNCVYFFNQRDDYCVDNYDPGEAFSIHFTTYEEIESESFCIPISNPGEITSILAKAEIAKGREDELTLVSLTYKLLARLSEIRDRSYSPRDERVNRAKDTMDSCITDPDCVKKAIEASGVSARRFGDLFKSALGITPNRYVLTRRIERSKELLSIGNVSVCEAAELCGFSDVYYFSKTFKREVGISPSHWRKTANEIFEEK